MTQSFNLIGVNEFAHLLTVFYAILPRWKVWPPSTVVARPTQPFRMRIRRSSCHRADSATASPTSIRSRRAVLSAKPIWSCRVPFKPSPTTTCTLSRTCPARTNRPVNVTWRIRIRILISRRRAAACWGMVRRRARVVRVQWARLVIGRRVADHQRHQQKLTQCIRNAIHHNSPSKSSHNRCRQFFS